MRSRRLEVSIVLAVVLSAHAFAQAVPPADSLLSASRAPSSHDVPEASKETFSARVREVNLLFSAIDWRGRFVSNLTAADIKVLDNGQQAQSLTYFLRQSDVALKIGLLIDVS